MGASAGRVVNVPPPNGGNRGAISEEARAQLAERMRQRGGMGPMVARLLAQRGNGVAAPPPITSSRSRSDMFTRARRMKTGAPGQTTSPLTPAPPATGY